MNFPEIENAVKHLKKISKCPQCKGKYDFKDMHIIASTSNEGLIEMTCPKCASSTIVTILVSNKDKEKSEVKIKEGSTERTHGTISQNDVLDVKNFLNNFDGNFENLFKE